MFDDPIIGHVESVLDHSQRDPSSVRNMHPRVGHQGDIKMVSACDAVHLFLDRTGIGIDVDVQQTKFL